MKKVAVFFQGKQGMGAQMDRLMGLARYQVCRMKDLSDKFHLLNEEPECVNVCFWYIPKRFRGKELNKEVQAELGKVIHFSHFSFFFLFSFCNSLFVLFYCAVWVYILLFSISSHVILVLSKILLFGKPILHQT